MSPNETPRNSRETAYSAIAIVAALVALIIAAIAYFAPNAQTPNENKPPIVAISASNYHSLALDGEGKVYAVGTSYFGQLGLGDNGWEADRKSFTLVDSLEGKKIVAIAAGSYYSLALSNDGIVYAAGNNRYGQLGLGDSGDENSRNVFTLVSSLEGRKIVAIAAGKYHSLTLDADGKVYATGRNNDGQLGLGDSDLRKTWTFVESLEDKKIVAVAAGDDHSLALDSDGKVYATGRNDDGQLGLGDRDLRKTWTFVKSLEGKKVIAISAGVKHSLALDVNGAVYATGYNYYGQSGLGGATWREIWTLVSLPDEKQIVAIAAGEYHSLALDSDGGVCATGANANGQLGLGDYDNRKSFMTVSSLKDKKIVAVAGGGEHSLALSSEGKVYATGNSKAGRLGMGDEAAIATFTLVPSFSAQSAVKISPSDKRIVAVAAGDYHSLALDANGAVYATGKNERGQLGLDDNKNRKTWTFVPSLEGKKIVAVAAGDHHSLALDKNGKVYAAGSNYKELGLSDMNDISDRKTFTFVHPLSDKKIIAISAGDYHSLALDNEGKVYATGGNEDGRLGLDDNKDRKTWTFVPSLEGKKIVAIAAGKYHSLTLDSEGKVYATGLNEYGELGLGDSGFGNDRNSFTPVSSLEGKKIVAIAAGDDYSLALDKNGKVYAAGASSAGKLGADDSYDRETFAPVSSLEGKKIVAMTDSFVIDSEGKFYAAGYNRYGQLGLGDENAREVWTLVPSLSDKKIMAIARSDGRSFAIDELGKLYATGNNLYGQLGLGDNDDRNVFTPALLFDR
ncbi:MAG: hypothetical protein LBO72_08330 [Helicobacteraceae bacterium]|jgi:alpha-tubulin suppressor-like RCC1 family protein|nr:hypothetical protein [Helicobacteraceae bacterium]